MPKQKEQQSLDDLQTLSFNNTSQLGQPSQASQSNFAIQFGDQPVSMKCPFCLQKIQTQLILKPQLISIVFGFFMFVMVPNIFMFFVVVVILQLTATRKHRCNLCQRQLGSDGKFLMFFKDQVYSFSIGTNGLIISKKILVTIGMTAIIFAILFFRVANIYTDITFTDLTWQKFYQQCPSQATSVNCLKANQGLTVKNWKGYIMRVQDNRSNQKRYFENQVTIFIKMSDQKTKIINRQVPDLLLSLSMSQIHLFSTILDQVSHGDQIIFNATFKNLRRGRQKGIPEGRHLNVINMQRTGQKDSEIHVFMTPQQDDWFFQAQNKKLRKHQQTKTQQENQIKSKQKVQGKGGEQNIVNIKNQK